MHRMSRICALGSFTGSVTCRSCRNLWILFAVVAVLGIEVSANLRPPPSIMSKCFVSLQNARPVVLAMLSGARFHIATILPNINIPDGSDSGQRESTAKGKTSVRQQENNFNPCTTLGASPYGSGMARQKAREWSRKLLASQFAAAVMSTTDQKTIPKARGTPSDQGARDVRGKRWQQRKYDGVWEQTEVLSEFMEHSSPARREIVKARAAFSTNVLLPLNQKISPKVKELKETMAEYKNKIDQITETVQGAIMPGTYHAKRLRKHVRGENVAHRSLYCAAPVKEIVNTCSDFENYQRWTGTGIKKITVLKKSSDVSVMRYKAGAFGLSFDFTLKWKRLTSPNGVPYILTFENVGDAGLIGSLNGAYVIDQLDNGVSQITFDFSSEISSRVPRVIKQAIGNMVVDIATLGLKKHTEEQAWAKVEGLPPQDEASLAITGMRSKVAELENNHRTLKAGTVA